MHGLLCVSAPLREKILPEKRDSDGLQGKEHSAASRNQKELNRQEPKKSKEELT